MERERERDGERERWSSGLPEHLLDLIAERVNFPDLYRFGSVCKPWRSVCEISKFPNHLPWLIVPHQQLSSSRGGTMAFDDENMGFYSICDGKIYKANIPEIRNRRICASFQGGWLMTVHGNSEVQLFNPFSRSTIHLPPLTKFPRVIEAIDEETGLVYVGTCFDVPQNFRFNSVRMRDVYIHKVAMSSSSSAITTGTTLVAIQGRECALAFYTIGANVDVWTSVTADIKQRFLTDLTYYKGKFYAVHPNGQVVVVRGLGEEQGGGCVDVEQVIAGHPSSVKSDNEPYILQSGEDLLVVQRLYTTDNDRNVDNQYSADPHRTVGFKVLKLDFGSPNQWVELQSLGDRSLFLGTNTSFSLSAGDFSGCKPNCIYFTDNLHRYFRGRGFGGYDLGVFNLEDGSIDKLLYPDDTLLVMPPPFWLAPIPAT